MTRLILCGLFAALLFAAAIASQTESARSGTARWYKGNLHTHTLNSDGDSTPFEVATWYREHGYQFLVLSDHNYLTDPGGLNSTVGAAGQFLLIPGEEVTDGLPGKPVHVNEYNPAELIQPQHGATIAAIIQNDVNAIRQAKALPSVNHPNFQWAITVEDMLAVKGLTHFEVYNGHPMVNNEGGGGSPSMDEMWDALLTAGRRLQGIAVDDAHYFKRLGKEFSNPGHGWVWVRASALSPEAIMRALESGDFYASTGVRLGDIRVSGGEYRIDIDRAEWEKTTTYFIGSGGKVLASSYDKSPRYRLTGTEAYVRARVDSSAGTKAWTQPVFGGR